MSEDEARDPEEPTRERRRTLTRDEEDQLPEFEKLLEYLKGTRNFDFRGYKRAGLMRRVTKRMRAIGIESFKSYVAFMETHQDEFPQLFNTILINVTSFFRDDLPWDYMTAEIIPRLIAQKPTNDLIRVWCAGCATGEEAYSLAMVLAEALGPEAFRERVKIYATDVDDPALVIARLGTYDESDVATIPAPLVERYFERAEQRYVFRKDLRRSIIFGRNDLMQDAPISRIDLLACRNTLMYFDVSSQKRILARFHFALNEGGFLFLGRAETMFTHSSLFEPVDLRRRVFAKATRVHGTVRPAGTPRLRLDYGSSESSDVVLRDAAFDAAIVAQIVVDRSGVVTLVNERARMLFDLGPLDIGRPLQDLDVSYRPFELRSMIDQAYIDLRTVAHPEIAWRTAGGEQRWFDLTISPVMGASRDAEGASISFVEVTRYKQLQRQLEDSQAELEAAYQELQSTNEELETTNEELHSTVEELETTNEELQSTNEELETMNEELQSTNEELQAINEELRVRSDELNSVNAFLESVFMSLRVGVAVLDRELSILVWNSRAEDLWGLREHEAERANFLNLDIGLPVEKLRPAMRACLSGDIEAQEVMLAATNRRGRAITCKVALMPLVARGDARPNGLIVLMEEMLEANPGRGGAGERDAAALSSGDDGSASDGVAGANRVPG